MRSVQQSAVSSVAAHSSLQPTVYSLIGVVTVSEFVEPLGRRVLIRRDESRQKTRGGIVLPDDAEIPTITGRVVEVSVQIKNDDDFPIQKYDKVLFHPKNAIPVDFESDNLLYVVPVDDIVAIFRRHKANQPALGSSDEFPDDEDPGRDNADG